MSLLQYSLGLNATNFLSGISASKVALAGLTALGAGVGLAIAGVTSQIARGANLQDLSNRTGETVANLVKLQRGFEITGVASEQVTGIIGALQRTMGGFNELGEPAKDIFAGIGLSVQELKQLDTPAVLEKIFDRLRQYNRNDAANAAGKIFGRGNGAAILQAARDGEDFSQSMKDAAEEAAIMAKNAPAFAALADEMTRIKTRIATVFAGFAGNATAAIRGAINSFKTGGLSEFLSAALAAGLEKAFTLLKDPNLWSGFLSAGLGAFALLGEGLLSVMEAPFARLQAGFDFIAQKAVELATTVRDDDGRIVSQTKAQGFDELLAERKKDGVSYFGSTLSEGIAASVAEIEAGAKKVREAYTATAKAVGPYGEAYNAILAKLPSYKPNDTGTDAISGAGQGGRAGAGSGSAVDALTRIGFFSGGGLGDPAARTASNTARLVQYAAQTNAHLKRLASAGGASFAGI